MAKHVFRIGVAGPLVRYVPKVSWSSQKNPYERHAYLRGLRSGARGVMPSVVETRYNAAWYRGFSEGCAVKYAFEFAQTSTDHGVISVVMLPRLCRPWAPTKHG